MYLLSKHRFQFILFQYLDNKMNIDAKEIIIKFFLVRMKEGCGDALFLKLILSLKKFLKESWLLQMAPDFRTPPSFY